MLAGDNKELQKILLLRNSGQYEETSKSLAKFEMKKHKRETTIRLQLIKACFVPSEQPWDKNLELIEQLITECELIDNSLLLLSAFYAKAFCLRIGEQFKKSNNIIEEAENSFENKFQSSNDFRLAKAWLLFLKGYNYNMMGQNQLAREAANHSLTIAETLSDIQLRLSLYELLGNNEFQAAKVRESINYYTKGLELAEEINYNQFIQLFSFRLAEGYGVIGDVNQSMKYCDQTIELMKKHGQDTTQMIYWKAALYYSLGEWDKAIPLVKEVLPSLKKNTALWGQALYLDGLAAIERIEGSLDKAIEYMNEAIALVKERDDIFRSMVLSVRLAPMLFDKGKFDQVLEICFAVLEGFKENTNVGHQALVFKTMGRTYHVKGEYNLAIEYIEKGLKVLVSPNEIAQSYFILIQISIDKNNKNMYNKYLQELEILANKYQTIYLEQIHQTAKALILKASTRPRDWIKAIDILIEVVKKKLTKHDFTIVALINLCELLMNEFAISGDTQILQEMEFYVDELTELAKLQNIYHLRLEANNLHIITHWLKAQKSMVDLDLKKARTLLVDTRKIADDEGLYRLAEKITLQQEKLLLQLSQWDDFIRKYYEFIKE